MIFLRALVVLMLGAGVACFVLYAVTGAAKYRALGVRIVKWTLVAAFLFFAVLFVERVAPHLF
jgi:hypothetical protein